MPSLGRRPVEWRGRVRRAVIGPVRARRGVVVSRSRGRLVFPVTTSVSGDVRERRLGIDPAVVATIVVSSW